MNVFRRQGRLQCARWMAAALGVAAVLLAACGGGLGEEGTGGGMSYSQGTVEGLGSVIVNGVRYDDSSAAVTDADGNVRPASALGLGMTVEVEAGAVVTGGTRPTATASAVRFASELLGPVSTVDSAAGRLTLLGQTVTVDAATVFGPSVAGLRNVAAGDTLEIHAEPELAAGQYRARRIDRLVDTGVAAYRLRGVIGQRDERNKRFSIGAGSFDYTGVPASAVADGRLVRLKLQKAPAGSTTWTVTEVVAGARALPEGREARLAGPVTALDSAQAFSVNGQSVNAAGLTMPAGFGLGARVEVTGKITGNAVRATQVVLAGGSEAEEFVLIGNVAALDTAARTFQLRGQRVVYPADVRVSGGTLADLANGRRVEVSGTLGPDGLVAERIEFER